MIKICGLDDVMIKFENKILDGQKTDQWSKSYLKLLPKSGNLSNSENYRGKALAAAVVKFVIKLILIIMKTMLDKQLPPMRIDLDLDGPLLDIPRRLIEEVNPNKLKAAIAFIDSEKAFDSV